MIRHVGYVPSPDIPATDLRKRIQQLEERCGMLEARNEYLEHLLDPRRRWKSPHLLIDNRDDEPRGAA